MKSPASPIRLGAAEVVLLRVHRASERFTLGALAPLQRGVREVAGLRPVPDDVDACTLDPTRVCELGVCDSQLDGGVDQPAARGCLVEGWNPRRGDERPERLRRCALESPVGVRGEPVDVEPGVVIAREYAPAAVPRAAPRNLRLHDGRIPGEIERTAVVGGVGVGEGHLLHVHVAPGEVELVHVHRGAVFGDGVLDGETVEDQRESAGDDEAGGVYQHVAARRRRSRRDRGEERVADFTALGARVLVRAHLRGARVGRLRVRQSRNEVAKVLERRDVRAVAAAKAKLVLALALFAELAVREQFPLPVGVVVPVLFAVGLAGVLRPASVVRQHASLQTGRILVDPLVRVHVAAVLELGALLLALLDRGQRRGDGVGVPGVVGDPGAVEDRVVLARDDQRSHASLSLVTSSGVQGRVVRRV